MLFNSLEFAVFFPIVTAIYFLLANHHRVMWLLVASCVFYMAFIPIYIVILFITILIDYVAGLYLERTTGKAKKVILWTSIIATCIVLFVLKYYNFFTGSFYGVATYFGWRVTNPTLDIVLPIGLSFHTFQSLSYVIEVYRGNQKAESNFLNYATYVMFFPQLVAGPIERPQNLLHQFREHHIFDYARVTSGLKRMAWGFFKKLVVADRLALYVNDVYGNPTAFTGTQLTVATIFFAYQIYCDFSGYSDIAIGSARVLGFRLMENFDSPYHSFSISEFWRRWHISLSFWFRDYVYFPLGGNRVTKLRWYFNLLVTFGLSGLWHGANWTYVIWGALNGVYLVVGVAFKEARSRFWSISGLAEDTVLRRSIMLVVTFMLICVGWVFFRANTVADAWYVLTHLHRDWDLSQLGTPQFLLRQLPVAILGVAFLEIIEIVHKRKPLTRWVGNLPVVPRWGIYAGFAIGVVMFGVYQKNQFIYFQF